MGYNILLKCCDKHKIITESIGIRYDKKHDLLRTGKKHRWR